MKVKHLSVFAAGMCCLVFLYTACKKPESLSAKGPLNLSLSTNSFASPPPAGLIHPGGFLLESDMERVRTNVAAGLEPWLSSWNAIKNTDASTTYNPRLGAATVVTDSYAMQSDGHAAWVLAIKWVASGDLSYANASIRVINQWVNQVTDMHACSTLRTGVGGSQMANAAEMLAHGFNGGSGWSAADIGRAKTWFKNIAYPIVSTGPSRSANWGTSALVGCMSMAIFCDDMTMYNYAVNAYKNGFTDTPDGCAGVTEYIDATGEDAESGRDQGHSQGGIGHLMEVAQMAFNQGLNLVIYNNNTGVLNYGFSGNNRVFTGLEYTAKYNLGNSVAYHGFVDCSGKIIYPDTISSKGRGSFSPFWEMATKLFNQTGLTPTYSQSIIQRPNYAPEPTNSDHPGIGTLLYRLPVAGLIVNGKYTMKNLNSGKMLDVSGAATANGTVAIQNHSTGTSNQQWIVTYLGNGLYSIRGVQSNRMLETAANSVADSAKVDIWDSNNGGNQKWIIAPVPGGYYTLKNVHSAKVLEVYNSLITDGAVIDQWGNTGNNNQKWAFTLITP